MRDAKTKIQDAISKGLDFLHRSQLPYGEFKTYVFPDKAMTGEKKYVSTTYITTFILYSLSFAKDYKADEMWLKGVNFLEKEMEAQGVWRFFGTQRSCKFMNGSLMKHTPISSAPDLDDTACAAFCLKKRRKVLDNFKVFFENRNDCGIFQTWLLDFPRRAEFDEGTILLQPRQNDIDCGVLSNILLYLGDREETQPSSQYVCETVRKGTEEENIPYFPDRFILYYLVSRAAFNGVKSLMPLKDIILKRIKEYYEKKDELGSTISRAYAICTFLNFESFDDLIHGAVKYMIRSQKQDGSWAIERFCDEPERCYGSEELTTAICLEALSRYERWNYDEA